MYRATGKPWVIGTGSGFKTVATTGSRSEPTEAGRGAPLPRLLPYGDETAVSPARNR
jgi:hypothetical protein